jgi:hypothetical protein
VYQQPLYGDVSPSKRGLTASQFKFRKRTSSTVKLVAVKHANLLDENCAIARSTGILGERWVWVVLRQAFNGTRRFEDFQRGIGLARNVLAQRLNWPEVLTIARRGLRFALFDRTGQSALLFVKPGFKANLQAVTIRV